MSAELEVRNPYSLVEDPQVVHREAQVILSYYHYDFVRVYSDFQIQIETKVFSQVYPHPLRFYIVTRSQWLRWWLSPRHLFGWSPAKQLFGIHVPYGKSEFKIQLPSIVQEVVVVFMYPGFSRYRLDLKYKASSTYAEVRS